ncbi:MAG: tRNA pseudouridine(38-40) synthase TruA [Ideonella sp. WA131b]|jgi:tRNA pseudouridine38-40 synthase|nr:tRNA pseudouridine(38-40) synthase TruA [Ideonella sp. WA131b]
MPSRLALGVSYRGGAYHGWQSQPGCRTVQDALEQALAAFADQPVRTVCAGRTDAGVHALNQVVHADVAVEREAFSWVRGTNRFLPADIAVQWAMPVGERFHARNGALGRRYRYLLRESPARPALDAGLVGWTFRPLDAVALREAAAHLVGTHDFSSFRSSACQSPTPVKTLKRIDIAFRGQPMAGWWTFEFDGNAFLHHMVRNLMGSLVMVGSGRRPPGWMAEVLTARDRDAAAPTFSPDGLCFLGPYYDPALGIPETVAAAPWLMP